MVRRASATKEWAGLVTTASGSPSLRLIGTDLACRRGGRLIFENVSFALAPGQVLALTGRNGAGKSSLIAMVAGRLRPEAGTIHLDGADGMAPAETMHVVGHRDGLKTALTVRENLIFARDLLGNPHLEPEAALAEIGLPHVRDLPVGYLSAGQRRRVALARLLVAHRPFWILDEPMAALDIAAQALFGRLMTAHRAAGGAVLAATHGPLGLAEVDELRIGA